MPFFQATAVSINGSGIMLCGASGSGKSDLALRLIQEKNAILIGDDGLEIANENGVIFLSPHNTIRGKLEVRGLGIIDMPCVENIPLLLYVNLVSDEPKRMPNQSDMKEIIEDVTVFSVHINPFHVSSVHKVLLALSKVHSQCLNKSL